MRMDLPKVLTSDQGGEFRSDLEKEITELLKITALCYTLPPPSKFKRQNASV